MTINSSDVKYELIVLNERHDLSHFASDNSELDDFIKFHAYNEQKQLLSVTRLACDQNIIYGFYSVANASLKQIFINKEDICCEFQYKQYPSLKIARLATNKDARGLGIGRNMLLQTIILAIKLSSYTGCRFIIVDAKKDSIGFYKKFGFVIPDSVTNTIKNKDIIPMYLDILKSDKSI